MLRKLLPLVALCAAAVAVPPAHADEEKTTNTVTDTTPVKRHGWGFRVGYLRGDEIAKHSVGISLAGGLIPEKPSIKNAPVFGAFYYNETSPHFRIEGRISGAKTEVEHVCPDVEFSPNTQTGQTCAEREGSVSALLLNFEVVFMPHFDKGKFHLGVPFGAGWGQLRANKAFAKQGWLEGKSFDVELSSGSGMSYFLGLRPYVEFSSGRQVFFEIRALRFHRLVNTYDRTAKTVEATVGMSFPFKKKKA